MGNSIYFKLKKGVPNHLPTSKLFAYASKFVREFLDGLANCKLDSHFLKLNVMENVGCYRKRCEQSNLWDYLGCWLGKQSWYKWTLTLLIKDLRITWYIWSLTLLIKDLRITVNDRHIFTFIIDHTTRICKFRKQFWKGIYSLFNCNWFEMKWKSFFNLKMGNFIILICY